jgi:formimidoylglutamate deiminase
MIVFALGRSAIRDVIVNGRLVVRDHAHALQNEIVAKYQQLHDKVWKL